MPIILFNKAQRKHFVKFIKQKTGHYMQANIKQPESSRLYVMRYKRHINQDPCPLYDSYHLRQVYPYTDAMKKKIRIRRGLIHAYLSPPLLKRKSEFQNPPFVIA